MWFGSRCRTRFGAETRPNGKSSTDDDLRPALWTTWRRPAAPPDSELRSKVSQLRRASQFLLDDSGADDVDGSNRPFPLNSIHRLCQCGGRSRRIGHAQEASFGGRNRQQAPRDGGRTAVGPPAGRGGNPGLVIRNVSTCSPEAQAFRASEIPRLWLYRCESPIRRFRGCQSPCRHPGRESSSPSQSKSSRRTELPFGRLLERNGTRRAVTVGLSIRTTGAAWTRDH